MDAPNTPATTRGKPIAPGSSPAIIRKRKEIGDLETYFNLFLREYPGSNTGLVVKLESNFDLTIEILPTAEHARARALTGVLPRIKGDPKAVEWQYGKDNLVLVAQHRPGFFRVPIARLFPTDLRCQCGIVACLDLILDACAALEHVRVRNLAVPAEAVEWLFSYMDHLRHWQMLGRLEIIFSQPDLAPIPTTRTDPIAFRLVGPIWVRYTERLPIAEVLNTMRWFKQFLWCCIPPPFRNSVTGLTITHILEEDAVQAALDVLADDSSGGFRWNPNAERRPFGPPNEQFLAGWHVILSDFEFPNELPTIALRHGAAIDTRSPASSSSQESY